MAIMHIKRFGDPALRIAALPVKDFNSDLKKYASRMAETMYDAPGVGLAANQVGLLHRLFVIDVEDELEAYVNPEILSFSQESDEMEEGCLSLPDEVKVNVVRPIGITLRARDLNGKKFTVDVTGLKARAIQHEIDHLDGKLIIDRVKPSERKAVMRLLKDSILSENPRRVNIKRNSGILASSV